MLKSVSACLRHVELLSKTMDWSLCSELYPKTLGSETTKHRPTSKSNASWLHDFKTSKANASWRHDSKVGYKVWATSKANISWRHDSNASHYARKCNACCFLNERLMTSWSCRSSKQRSPFYCVEKQTDEERAHFRVQPVERFFSVHLYLSLVSMSYPDDQARFTGIMESN